MPFNNSFRSIIHQNDELSKLQKFQYLLSSLKGDAANLVNSLELSNANYDVAMKIIKDRYDSNRVIINGHVKEIFDIPQMRSENSHQLKVIIDGVTKHLQALKSLGRPLYNWVI